MKISRDLAIVFGLLGVLTILQLVLLRQFYQTGQTLEVTPFPSTYHNGPSGTKAFYLLLQESGYSTKRWERKWSDLTTRDRTLFVLEPMITITPKETRDLLRWVREGGTAFLAGESTSALLSEIGRVEIENPRDSYSSRPLPRRYRPLHPAPCTKDFDSLLLKDSTHLVFDSRAPGAWCAVIGDEHQTLVAVLRVGLGKVIAISSWSLFSNESLPLGGNSVLASNLLFESDFHQEVLFDEYHHGFQRSLTLFDLACRPPTRAILLIILITLAFILHNRGKRFGAPVTQLQEDRVRQPVEFVVSMARLYRQAGARTLMMQYLLQRFWERLLKSRKDEFQQKNWKTEAAQRFPKKDLTRLERIVSRLETTQGTPCSEAELLELAQELDIIREELYQDGRKG